MIAQMSVRIILALKESSLGFFFFRKKKPLKESKLYFNPSAGIGRQGELKIR